MATYSLAAVAAVINMIILFYIYRMCSAYKYRDYMTRLHNKLYLEKIIKKWLAQRKDFTVCFFDMDKFKMLNDTYGHMAGDKGIIHFANVLSQAFKKEAVAARIGGDEFAVIVPNSSDADLEEIFDSLRAQCFIYNGKSIYFTVSIGACRSDKAFSYEHLMEATDKKLYANKKTLSQVYALNAVVTG